MFDIIWFWILSLFSSRYKLAARWTGVEANCIAMSKNGILAGGGPDGIQLWNLETKRSITSILQMWGPSMRGQVSCVAWMSAQDGSTDTLVCGTVLGYLILWSQISGEVSIFVYHSRPHKPGTPRFSRRFIPRGLEPVAKSS